MVANTNTKQLAMPQDQLLLNRLQLMAVCGALPEEQNRAQPFEVNVELGAEIALAGASDELSDTVDYGMVCDAVSTAIQSGRFTLMETMAQKIADVCFACDARVVTVTIEVHKLRPPVPHQLATSGVRITRQRQ